MNKTVLEDRILWYDGDSTVSSSSLAEWVNTGRSLSGIFVDQVTNEIQQFNKLVDKQQQITKKTDISPLDFSWKIPQEYQHIDLVEFLTDKLYERCGTLNEEQWEIRAERISDEYQLYQQLNLLDVLRVIIYIINTLESQGVVWGIGRGSSVSSFILYVIGVHDVDSVTYDLDIEDFLRAD